MTDKEMAEEYIKDNCERWERDCLCVDDIAKENFLAGLKAEKPQWHDLRKDPNDLSEDSPYFRGQSVRVTGVIPLSEDKYISLECRYYYSEKKWRTQEDYRIVKVVAWIEIPRYTEEKPNISQEIINKPVTMDIKSSGFGEIESTFKMTDEELAVQYADKIAEEYRNVKSDNGGYVNIKEAFLNGLKLGRLTKWHKVADGDLPKRDERFSTNISITVMTQDDRFAFYCFDDKKWYFQGVEIGNAIAWCEIPKYEES